VLVGRFIDWWMWDVAEGRNNMAGERKIDYFGGGWEKYGSPVIHFLFQGRVQHYACFRKYTHYSP
jgi:hypothetical protein